MKAILVNEDKSLRWDNVPDPVVGPEDCLVKIEATALNRADLMQREGDYPPPPGCPEWMGLEIAGTIVKVGKVAAEKSKWKEGDKVCALLGGGGYAEYANVKYDMLMPIPENCSMVEAAAIPEAFATAYLNLFGIRVITTVRSDEKAEAIRDLGADIIVNTKREDLVEVLKTQLEEGHPVDVAIDCVGGEIVGKCVHYLKHGARWIMIAALSGYHTEIDLKNIYVRNVRLIGSTLRSRAPEVKAQILANLVKDIWPKVENGEIKPTIHAVLPIQSAEEAQDILYKGQNVGKVVLTVG